jgi:hypothetical protein
VFLKTSPLQLYLGTWSPLQRFNENRSDFLENSDLGFFLVGDGILRALFLELECSPSPSTDLWCINSQISNINNICPAVQAPARRTYIYKHILSVHTQTDRETGGIPKTTFSYSGGWKRVNSSKSKDYYFHDHNIFSYYVYEKVKNGKTGKDIYISSSYLLTIYSIESRLNYSI